MRMEWVVITGMGTVNALAKNTAAFARALQESACRAREKPVYSTQTNQMTKDITIGGIFICLGK